MGPIQPHDESQSSNQPPPPKERRHRPDELAATPSGPAGILPPLLEDPGAVFDVDWDPWYRKCPTWREAWEKIQDDEAWPGAFQLLDGKLYESTKLCKPLAMTSDNVRAHHCATGHIGAKWLIIEMDRLYN